MIASQPLRDRTVYVVAGSPSVTLADVRAIGRSRARDECRVIAVNDAVYPCWFADHLHACDHRWWIEHNGVPGFAGVKTALEITPFPDVTTLVNSGRYGFDPTPGHVRTGSNSGFQALHLAASLGATTVILLGVDFTDDGARSHWFGLHPGALDQHSNVEQWRDLMRDLTDELERRGLCIMNAGRQSTLSWLPQIDLGSS